MMIIQNKFNQEQIVYLKTDVDQRQRMVTAICIRGNNITYELSFGDRATWHQEIEISETVDILKATTN